MGKKIISNKTTKNNNTILETLDVPEVQLDTTVVTTVEPVVEQLYTKFNVVGLGTLTVLTPITVEQFVEHLKVDVLPCVGSVLGVNHTNHNKIPQNLQLHKSTVENPVKYFFSTIDQVVQSGITTRKGIIEHYVGLGVSYYTVRTQYQVWYGLNKKGLQQV